ncbi:MAG: hypothetical protein P8N28_02190, partial [Phycisphaerales bacterium]|nr:hypothetical protein [Phycisphaerales bacterium]
AVNCWDDYQFNTTSCAWENLGTQDPEPVAAGCWETITFNTTSCSWDVTGTQDPEPVAAGCWETITFNTISCSWDVTGTQDPQPVIACWETATFNTISCSWIVTGTQDTDSASNEAWVNQLGNGGATAALNYHYLILPLTQGDTLIQLDYSISWKNHGWGNSGIQSNAKVNLYDSNNNLIQNLVTIFENNSALAATYHIYAGSIILNLPISMGYNVKVEINAPNWGGNTWESWINSANITAVTATQDPEPVTECWETATFNATTCVWDITGIQDPEPSAVNCWDDYQFNITLCAWENVGSQPAQPTLPCYESVGLFNTVTCAWDIESNEIVLDTFTAKSPICRYDKSIITIEISNSISNTYTILLQDSILKSFVIDSNGLLIPEGISITLTPNFSGKVKIVSLTDEAGCTQIFNDSVHIEVKQLPQLTLDDTDICKGEPSFLLNSATPIGGVYFIDNEENTYFDAENLQIGSHDIRYEYTDPNTYPFCSNEIEKIITINAPPVADFLFSPQPTDINNPSILFRDNSSNDILNSVWDLGNGTIIYDESSFWHTYTDTAGTYTIRYYITNIYGCTDSVINQLTINPIYRTYIPSSFTP